ncbi:hypothetical protein CN918_25745 [Priestia megaterium]|nr:hypothetical protein CN918_25745 [Priestia megaterium]
MNVLITSGSIVETIDNVYYIGQKSDESIAAIIGEEFSKQNYVDNLFFVYGEKSRFPWESSSSNDQKFFLDDWVDKVGLYPVSGMIHLTETLTKILDEHHIDVVIHLMSIPNYGKTAVHLLRHRHDAAEFIKQLASNFGLDISFATEGTEHHPPAASTFGKMKTGYKRVFLEQKPQEKVLSFIQTLAPAATLISSKFEYNVSSDDLLTLAHTSLNKNNSHMVLTSDIEAYKNGDEETYFLVSKTNLMPAPLGSDDIAQNLVDLFHP